MLEIGLVPKASASTGFGRFYPHQGYLGLSPVIVAGTIVSRLPPLCPTLPMRQVTIAIRCLETRTIGSDVESVLWEKAKRLWEPAGEDEYEELGDWSSPFQVVIPVEAARAAASAQWTRDLKVVWQLQVSFEHRPIPYVGNRIVKTYLLDLHSYLNYPVPPPSPPSPVHLPGAQISMNAPHGVFGPGETFTLSLHVKPDDPAVSIRRSTLILERRTQLLELASAGDKPEKKDRRSPSAFPSWRRSNSPQPYTKLSDPAPNMHVSKVLEVTNEEAVPSSGGAFWVSLTGTIPKRGGNWEAGESGATKLTATTFDCRVKIAFKTRGKPTKELICPLVPIVLVGSSAAERSTAQAALAAEADNHVKVSLPKRRHRSSRRGLYMQEGTTDIADPVVAVRPTRRRHKTSNPASPTFATATAIKAGSSSTSAGVKPILLPPNPAPQPQSISFAFPAHSEPPRPALPITTLIHPPSPTSPAAAMAGSVPNYLESVDPFSDRHSVETAARENSSYPDMSILRRYQSSGRRISASTSEEEEMQPSRSRMRLEHIPSGSTASFHSAFPPPSSTSTLTMDVDPSASTRRAARENDRPSLPSLDVLGLGLPPVPEYDRSSRRPRTAPVHSAFPSSSASTPPRQRDRDQRPEGKSSSAGHGRSSMGERTHHSGGNAHDRAASLVPPPLSGALPFFTPDGRVVPGTATATQTWSSRPATMGPGTWGPKPSHEGTREEEGEFAFGVVRR